MKMTSLEKKWILYDVGNSAFILLTTAIIPLYFNNLAKTAGIKPSDYLAYWGYALSFVTLFVALTGPVLGTVSDMKGKKVKIFALTVILGCLATLALSLPTTWLPFLMLFIVAKIAYNLSLVVYDAMLIDVTEEDRMDSVSTHGFAWGYIGSCIPFIISLVIALKGGDFGLSSKVSFALIFAINAGWWFIFSLPLLKSYRQTHYLEHRLKASESWQVVKETIGEIQKDKTIFFFLIAFFFYIDGVHTIINMSVAYGESLGLDGTGLLLALLMTQLIAFPCSLFFSKLSRKYDTAVLIKVCIVAYFMITAFAVQLDQLWEFWMLAAFVGMFQGGIQALSRSYYGKIIPPEESGKYFGVYDICGKGASMTGTFVISTVSAMTGNQSLGIVALPIFFVIGYFFFVKSVKENKMA